MSTGPWTSRTAREMPTCPQPIPFQGGEQDSSAAGTGRRIKKHRSGCPRIDERQAGKGTASPLSARSRATAKTAVEMTSPWTPQHGVHRDLEISHSTRDSHIPTANPRVSEESEEQKNKNTKNDVDQQPAVSVATPVVAGFEGSISGQFSGPPRTMRAGRPPLDTRPSIRAR